ncbi:hypothetical protein CANCADRAFT_57688 [Tortispora caseinolytica NRRL Y-17796]|uniref:FAD/NAD(P)-binding domain-containing protein n=1 Tax=Tortispora caseinolytica NRRL Y-17796 TaxID=767744 RepID=A0A1E4T9Q2_9ASCO|nr:hypothetical protein CANCADRAFT_57688 [Tortispora caseinolytica NRRL Y-17796]
MTSEVPEYDAAIIGAGFSGCYLMYHLRKMGLKVHGFDAGTEFGGTWHWNRYPGARVDSHTPFYELAIPESQKDWKWTQTYPGQEELQNYFRHLDKTLNLSKDYDFKVFLTDAIYDEKARRWDLYFKDGKHVRCRIFLPCLGLSAAPLTPEFKNLDQFKGDVYHTSNWPEHLDLKDKSIAIIGTGASGVQCIQELGPIAKQLYVFQRSPNLCLPMPQEELNDDSPQNTKEGYADYYANRAFSFSGFDIPTQERKGTEDGPEEKQKFFQEVWDKKGFSFWVGNYADLFFDKETNDAAYKFWRSQVIKRIKDPKKAAILAPEKAPYPFGCRRPCMETDYYEQFNRPNVDIIDVNTEPILEFTEDGIVTKTGERKIDTLILATGFDTLTGPFTRINIKGLNNQTLTKKWGEEGASTFLAVTTNGFPNLFFLGGPQSPIAFSNNPSTIEVQANAIFKLIKNMNDQHIEAVNPKREDEQVWSGQVRDWGTNSLFHLAKGWYMGTNVPGKKPELISWLGGLPSYKQMLERSLFWIIV